MWQNDFDLILGWDPAPAGDNRHFRGILDDFRIYSRPLNLTDVQTLYTEGGWPL